MTRKIAISVPDDVAERLDREPNVSAFITEAVRQRMVSENIRATLARVGRPVSEEGVARARAQLDAMEAAITPELREAAEQLRERLRGGRWA